MPSGMSTSPCCGGKPPERRPRPRRAGRLRAGRRLAALLLPVVLGTAALAFGAESLPECPETKDLCIQAERSGGIDLKTGLAFLEGNVSGIVRSRDLRFWSGKLTAYRGSDGTWERLVLEGGVRMTQPGREATADVGILEPDRIRLRGSAHLEQKGLVVDGDEIVVLNDPERFEVHGREDQQLRIVLQQDLLPAPGTGEPGPEAPVPGETVLSADRAVIDQSPRRIRLTGAARVEQTDRSLSMQAESATFEMNAEGGLAGFRAEGGVEIKQPGREVSADRAQSRNGTQTIVLTGNARLRQPDQFDLTSERIEIYSDAEKGVVQSEQQQQPITLSLDLGGKKAYRLSEQGLNALRSKGVPQTVVGKLAPLVGRSFENREAFSNAAGALLTPEERDRYLETIVTQAG